VLNVGQGDAVIPVYLAMVSVWSVCRRVTKPGSADTGSSRNGGFWEPCVDGDEHWRRTIWSVVSTALLLLVAALVALMTVVGSGH
jgi:hypothetical protein